MSDELGPFLGPEHRKAIEKINQLWTGLHELEAFANEHSIEDIFQDNGAKVLQQLIYLNMKILPGREGNDSISVSGTEWEMKSVNIATHATGFSTNHHTNHDIIAKYKQVPWSFAIYEGIKLLEIYVMRPETLQPIFDKWEAKLQTMTHLNNPKIPVSFVRENGIKVFPINYDNPIDPDSINV